MRSFFGLLLCVNGLASYGLPLKLSETDLYQDIGKKIVSSRNRSYSPQYPLWTDGALKERWVYLSPTQKIVVDNTDQWIFPTGTKFWKEFSFRTGRGSRRVETRYIEKVSPDEWAFASYLWNSEETEAVLAPEEGIKDYYPINDSFRHSIPSVTDCLRCHRKQGDGILGFDAIQLSNDRDPNALHAELLENGDIQLRNLIEDGFLNQNPVVFKNGDLQIPSKTQVGRVVMGYFHGNCASCHNSFGSSMHMRMDLSFNLSAASEMDLNATKALIDKKCSVFQFPNEPIGFRVVKGDPERSILVRMMQGHGSEKMPPIASVIHDGQAIHKIREWITGIP